MSKRMESPFCLPFMQNIWQIFLQIFLHSSTDSASDSFSNPEVLAVIAKLQKKKIIKLFSRIENLTTLFTLLCNWCSCDKWELKSNHCLLKLCKSLSRKVSFTKNKPVNFIHLSGFSLQKRTFAFKKEKRNGILLPKLFWPTVRKNCSSDQEKLLKFEAKGREFAKCLRSLKQFIQKLKARTIFGNTMLFQLVPGGFLHLMN